jgi:hypothetical protein
MSPCHLKLPFLTFTPILERLPTSRIGDRLINYLASTVERLVPLNPLRPVGWSKRSLPEPRCAPGRW